MVLLNFDTAPVGGPEVQSAAGADAADSTVPSPEQVPRNWRLNVAPRVHDYPYDLEEVAAVIGRQAQLAQLREDPGSAQALAEFGSALVAHIKGQMEADGVVGHATVTLRAGTNELAFPGLSLAQLVADDLGSRTSLAVPWQTEPLGVCQRESQHPVSR